MVDFKADFDQKAHDKDIERSQKALIQYMKQFETSLKAAKEEDLGSKVSEFRAISDALATMMQFMLVQRDNQSGKLNDIKWRLAKLVDQVKKSKPKDDLKQIKLLTDLKKELKGEAQSSLIKDIDYLKSLKEEVKKAIDGTQQVIADLIDKHKDKTWTVFFMIDEEHKKFEATLKDLLEQFKNTLKERQNSVKEDQKTIDAQLETLTQNVAQNNALILKQTQALEKNTLVISTLQTGLEKDLPAYLDKTKQDVEQQLTQTKDEVREAIKKQQSEMVNERKKIDLAANTSKQEHNQALSKINGEIVSNSQKVEKIKQETVSAVTGAVADEFKKGQTAVNQILANETRKINSTVEDAMKRLATPNDVEKVKEGVDKIAEHVNKQSTDNLDTNIKKAANQAITNNQNAMADKLDKGLQEAAEVGAMKGLARYNAIRAEGKKKEQEEKNKAAQVREIAEKEKQKQKQIKKDEQMA